MRIVAGIALAAALASAGGAAAQTALKPGTPSVLVWTPQQQSDGYRAMETIYRVNTIHRGETVHALPRADRQIDPTFEVGGKSYTVDSFMAANRMSGVLVIKDGRIVLERYAMGRKPDDRWTSFSVAKSVTSTLVGAAIADGKIAGVNAPVVDYIPELKGSGYDGVTVRQLLMMSSGVKWNEDYADPKSDVAQAGTAILEPGVNPMVSYMRKLPRAHEPGTIFHYNTGETDLVGVLVSNAVGMSLSDYASEKIWKPYGMERDAVWMTDLAGHERGGCCISMTLRDYGRVGQFILDGGVAGGKRILPEGWTAEATSKQIDNGSGGYGYFWWMVPGGYQAAGIFGQSITTYPKDRVIVVTNAAWPQADADAAWIALGAFDEAMRAAATGG
ncbi:MAG: serine hydrolase [Phenylobacterium sp.]|uniref:serine hydrolase domain-containing protein n=1 Tax=Phenylobacterium sp. TaxID=1871053 RepID=UPI0025F70D27|nr:serine hydrolase [Phenylobacterium sp.]MBI1200443.1 serine hydrolase [Phenylobacterium sp.]